MTTIAIYGGSFDPPHYGHLKTALSIQQTFHFDRFIFVPCKEPVLKNASIASSQHRVAMLELTLKGHDIFEIDQREIKRDSASYMVETLQSFRDELGEKASITLLLGLDAFLQLPAWHRWQDILTLSHQLVMKRSLPHKVVYTEPIKSYLLTHRTSHPADLLNHACGKIIFHDAGQYDISSSWLRCHLYSAPNIKTYLPENVLQYIYQHKLYI